MKHKEQTDHDPGGSRSGADRDRATGSAEDLLPATADQPLDGASPVGSDDSADDFAEWDDYVPEGIFISEERRQELRREAERYVRELIEEVGEPSAEEMARAEAWWRPIEQHLMKGSGE